MVSAGRRSHIPRYACTLYASMYIILIVFFGWLVNNSYIDNGYCIYHCSLVFVFTGQSVELSDLEPIENFDIDAHNIAFIEAMDGNEWSKVKDIVTER